MSRAARTARTLALALLAGGLAALSCDPGTVSVEILDYDSERDAYAFRVVGIETLENVSRLEGRATKLVGDAEIRLDYQTNLLKWVDPGYRVAFGAVRADGVLVPEDFDSLAMVSIYYQIERSLLAFEELGLDASRLVPMETYYWPRFTIVDSDGEKTVMEDNAFYMYATRNDRGFYVFPYEQFGWLPLSMNGGVMTHEFSHAVFDALVTVPHRAWIDAGGLSRAAANFLYGLNEGFADTIAVARLGDPDYMGHSIAGNTFSSPCNGAVSDVVRDASRAINYSEGMDDDARTVAENAFCPYAIGAFVSSLMYETAQVIDGIPLDGDGIPSAASRTEVAAAFLRALDLVGQGLAGDFELSDFFDLFAGELPAGPSRAAACAALSERYAMYYGGIESCQGLE